MADGNFTVSSSTPEIFTRVRGEISDSRGDVSLIRASGEEVPATKGTKIYLNDTLSSRDDSAVIAYFGDSGVLVLGQNQQVPLASDFFNKVDSLEQTASANTGAQNASAQPDGGIDLAALEQAIQSGQNIEELLAPTAAGGDSSNESGASSSVVFYQRIGGSLFSESGFDTSIFDPTQTNTINPFDAFGDLDSNNQLNGVEDAPVNDAPTIDTATGSTQVENNGVEGATVAIFTASDADLSDTITFSITSGNTTFFAINAATGVVTLTTAGAAAVNNDALVDTDYALGVTSNDGTVDSDEAFTTVTFDGVNDAPTIDTNDGSTQVENNGVEGATVATFTASDVDASDVITYSITTGNTTFFEMLDPESGVVTLTTAGAAAVNNDALVDTDYVLGVTANDGTVDSAEAFATVTFDGVNDGIIATANTYTTDEDIAVVGNLMDDGTPDSDPELAAGSIITSNLTLQFNASLDTAGDDIWENSASTAFDFDLDNLSGSGSDGNFIPADVTSSFPGITQAYSFNVNSGDSTGASFSDGIGTDDESFQNLPGNPTNNSATFELWFKANDVLDNDVLFETGASGDGVAIRIDGTVVMFDVKNGNGSNDADVRLSFDLASIGVDPTAEFVQVAGVINISGDVELYINGSLAAVDTTGDITDWDGSNDGGLGFNNEGINYDSGTATPFEGQIASFNFYESALSGSDVLTNFQAIAGFSVTQVDGKDISLNTPIDLPNGSIIIAADGSYLYTPDTDFSGVETFQYTIANHQGDTDTDTITITVNETNDGPTVSSTTITVDEESIDTSLGLIAPVDPEGDTIDIKVTGLPIIGTITLANGSSVVNGQILDEADLIGLQYDAPADYNGIDPVGTFTYTADDGQGDANSVQTGTVSINVNPIADPGSVDATPDSFTTDEDVAVSGNLITNNSSGMQDSDSDLTVGQPFTNTRTLSFDASNDAGGDDNWSSTTPSAFGWDFDGTSPTGSFSPVAVTSALVGISQAYSFNVNAADSTGAVFSNGTGDDDAFQDLDGNPTDNSATFELWFRADDTAGHEVLFETGATGNGTSIRINGTVLEFFVKNGGQDVQLSFDLASVGIDPTAEFVQVTGVINDGGNVELYVNGTLAAQDTSGVIQDWDGGDDAGLGVTNGSINFGSIDPFEGQIAQFNFYESALTSGNVFTNYQAVAGIAVTEVNGSAITDLTSPIRLVNGDLIIAADGSYQYTPDANYNGIETFTYTLTNTFGVNDTATVTIDVASVNDAPVISATDGSTVTSSVEVLDQEFTGVDIQSLETGSSDDANGTDPSNLTLERASNVTLTFVSESAGYSNSIGYYLIDPSGNVSTANILWANSNAGLGGSSVSFTDIPPGEIGFFLIQNGYSSNPAQIDAAISGAGFVRFENAVTGDPSTKFDPDGSVLVYYSEGTEDSPAGTRTELNDTFHASYSNLNPDGVSHSQSGIDAGDDNVLTIGFEDLPGTSSGTDWDLKDFVFNVEINSVDYNLSVIDPLLTIADDGAQLVSASVAITAGQATDELVLSNVAEAIADSYGITYDYDAATQTLSLSGLAGVAQYEEVLSSIQLASVDPLGTNPRAIEYNVTDDEGSTSLVATVNLNTELTSGNDFIAGSEADDTLVGLGGDDIIFGKAGSDNISGGAGSDDLSGGAGSDTFIFKTEDADGSTDTISDFTLSVVNADGSITQGDVLNFVDLLEGENGDDAASLTNYLNVSFDGATGDSTITVDSDGVGGDTDLTVVLQGVDLSQGIDLGNQAQILESLIDDKHLIVDNM